MVRGLPLEKMSGRRMRFRVHSATDHNLEVSRTIVDNGGSGPNLVAICDGPKIDLTLTYCERPETWVTRRTGHMGNTFRLL
jgi:hypothetical protein